MLVYVSTARHRHEADFMQALAGALSRLGHDITHDPGRQIEAAVVWNGRDWKGRVPTLYCECGWLPRWWYQLSHTGINAASHLSPLRVPDTPLTHEDRLDLAKHLDRCRTQNPYGEPSLRHPSNPLPEDLPQRFVLCPLQMAGDTNMANVDPARRTPQGLVDWVSAQCLPLPVVYKMHPAQHEPLDLQPFRPQDMLCPATVTIADLLASGRVAQVVTANSNTYHDALLWGVPARALDRGIWGDPTESPADTAPYLLALKRAQWSLDTARNWRRVRKALECATADFANRAAVEVVTPGPVVNICKGNRGWLFEDLARHLERLAPRAGCRVAITEAPVPDADAYLYMRADEAARCPHPERAVCQLHDQWGNWHGRFNAVKVAGWSLTHPDQYAMLSRFVDLRGNRSLLLPLGAPEAWKPRETLPADRFDVAWVGRAVGFKRLDWYCQACRDVWQAIPGFRAVLLGANLEPWAQLLREYGVPVDHREKPPLTPQEYISAYQGHYCGFGAVVICSNPDGNGDDEPRGEAHPLPLFEALACGVPVIASHVGYAPWLAPYLFIGQKGLRECIVEAYRQRERDFARRREFARLARQWGTLESWCVANLKFALEVARQQDPR